jgi:hypothetical protein
MKPKLYPFANENKRVPLYFPKYCYLSINQVIDLRSIRCCCDLGLPGNLALDNLIK